MSSTPDHESDSSLPPHITFPSSPPILTRNTNAANMDQGPAFKSEPPLTQNVETVPPPLRRVGSNETQRPASARRSHDGVDEQADVNAEDLSEEENTDPAERIEDFDWDDLHHRYHEAIKKCHGDEAELMQEWESLMAYFRVWANSGHEHETDRTYSRLRTRMTYVQHSEAQLEQKRNHYINVVRAFESALNLLKANGFGR
ncbi:hypothetical protein BDW02DRAFT_566750 [Decorospora gaudefroyi]|uniref:Uncharacterized protein n=1 Tax=Decorospora gaudefroyi TaxID=184978 RepID=A0A6A5KHP3_9PLEO|nr:hypothetical protein BDW02DRAFT_566750 [Decorospora gaudefroyi]